jgi:tetratricopeptide (TPR) repeat protein
MSTSAPSDPQKSDQTTASGAPVAISFEEKLRHFWEKNSRVVYISCAAIIAAILVRGGLDYLREQKEKEIAAAYASATTSERLKAFASAHSSHVLGGAAELRLADEAYEAGKYTEAVAGYQKAAEILKDTPFAARAEIGIAVSQILAGQTADGEGRLQRFADNASQPATLRAEAAYHLATLRAEAGRIDEANALFDRASALDPTGIWAQRSMMQRATLQTSATP